MTRLVVIGLTALLVGACVPTTPPAWLVQPADPNSGTRTPRYASVTSGVKRFGVVEPKDWRELNRAVGPQGGQGGGMNMPGMNMPGMNMPGMDMGNKPGTGGR